MDADADADVAVPWLDPEEMRAWLALVAVTQSLPTALDSALRMDAGICLFDYLVLAMLSQAEQRSLACTELARQVNGSLSRLSHTLDRLAANAWVERVAGDGDRRVTVARLTLAGLAVVERVAPAHVRSVRSLVFDGLDAAAVTALGDACASIAARSAARH